MKQQELEALLAKTVAELAEHFDAIQIVGSVLLPSGDTACCSRGSGNWYARKAMCQELVERDQARTIEQERRIVDDQGGEAL